MRWRDEGVIIHYREYGESKYIVTVLTKEHGKRKGLFAFNKKNKYICECGNLVQAQWNGRLSEQLGFWKFEIIFSPIASLLTNYTNHNK